MVIFTPRVRPHMHIAVSGVPNAIVFLQMLEKEDFSFTTNLSGDHTHTHTSTDAPLNALCSHTLLLARAVYSTDSNVYWTGKGVARTVTFIAALRVT